MKRFKQFNENWDGVVRKGHTESILHEINVSLPRQAEFEKIAKEFATKKLKRAATRQAITQTGLKIIKAVGKPALLRMAIKTLGKETARSVLKKVPFVGLTLGAIFAANRFAKGEYVKAAVELVGGVASTIPGFGTAVAIACDAALIAGDVSKIFAMNKDMEKVRAGRMSKENFKMKYNLEKLKNESAETERWLEIDSAVEQMINECNEIDYAIEDVISEMREDGEEVVK